ncbi:MAG: hypothetical protein IBX55_20780 [Methyloprofundus sp.]|nr:hypothetical protein [Methyloprofundus sp.]
MSAVFNKASIFKASKGAFFALFGFVFAAIKVVGLFFWNAFFGQDREQDDTPIGGQSWSTKSWGSFNYDENGNRKW